MKENRKSRFSEAQNESIFAAFAACCIAIMGFVACEPVWIPRSSPTSWQLQESANVCIEVSPAQNHLVIEAIDGWNMAIGKWKRLTPQIGINNHDCDYAIKEVDPPLFANQAVLATTNAIGGRYIELYRGKYEIDTLTVVLHEIGHALGAQHMIGTLMSPILQLNLYKCPDAPTVAQVAIANQIEPMLLRWCNN